MITIKKSIPDKKYGSILEPFFGRNMVILYDPGDEYLIPGQEYIVKIDKNLIPAGKDKRGVPLFIRRCSIIKQAPQSVRK